MPSFSKKPKVIWDDKYRCAQYSQASAPHFSIGILQDEAGDDRYLELTGDPSYEGSDVYPGDVTDPDGLTQLDFAGNGKLWVKTMPGADSPGYCGAGIDSE